MFCSQAGFAPLVRLILDFVGRSYSPHYKKAYCSYSGNINTLQENPTIASVESVIAGIPTAATFVKLKINHYSGVRRATRHYNSK